MNTTLILTFIILNIVNVILQTCKSLATVKCGKFGAALVNAVAYGLSLPCKYIIAKIF